MTITDLGAQGFQAMRFGNPLDGLDLSLVRADGPQQGQVFKITKSPLIVGRAGGDMIIKDRRVSSKHAQLDVAGFRVLRADVPAANRSATKAGVELEPRVISPFIPAADSDTPTN